MFLDRYDKNGNQIKMGDYLVKSDGTVYKVDIDPSTFTIGIKDKDSIYYPMTDWVKEDWEVKDYKEIFPN